MEISGYLAANAPPCSPACPLFGGEQVVERALTLRNESGETEPKQLITVLILVEEDLLLKMLII